MIYFGKSPLDDMMGLVNYTVEMFKSSWGEMSSDPLIVGENVPLMFQYVSRVPGEKINDSRSTESMTSESEYVSNPPFAK